MSSTAYLFELVRLIVVVQRHPSVLVGIPSFLESSIIQATGFRQLCFKSLRLHWGGIETVRVCLAHLGPSLLVLDVAPYSSFRDMPDRPYVVGPAPQRRELRAQMPKLLAQKTRGVPLELGSQLCR